METLLAATIFFMVLKLPGKVLTLIFLIILFLVAFIFSGH